MGFFSKLFGGEQKPAAKPAAAPAGAAFERPAPRAKNNYIIVIFDSCRYDAFMAAKPRIISKLGTIEKRYSYASWTAPSHYNLLMGLLPHHSPTHVFASDYYKKDFLNYNTRLGSDGIDFENLIPSLYLPTFMRHRLGYFTNALVSLPVLNPKTIINKDFDSFKLMPKHNDMAAMLPEMKFSEERPSFYLLNVGETHYPYALPTEKENDWPRIHGVHGVFKNLNKSLVDGKLVEDDGEPKFFDQDKLDQLRERQVATVRYLDTVVEKLFDLAPRNTYITITADHGELFGEDGYFGHGPINHEKCYEVPFVEGKIR